MPAAIPVIDLFAGPGGLGEGFASFEVSCKKPFKIVLSIEKDPTAFETLKLRSFFRQFKKEDVPDEYYQYLRGEIKRSVLFRRYPAEHKKAKQETWRLKLGSRRVSPQRVNERIERALNGSTNWVLIGGPPCQAYSLIGRVKIKNESKKKRKDFEKDHRHFLYREYLKIIAVHRPPIFVMENVPGILSSKVNGTNTFDSILRDLRNPCQAISELNGDSASNSHDEALDYEIYSLVKSASDKTELRSSDYIIKSESFGIPQARHRVILLGIRSDIKTRPAQLSKVDKPTPMWDAISDLARIRSRLSKEEDSNESWKSVLQSIPKCQWFSDPSIEDTLRNELRKASEDNSSPADTGAEFLAGSQTVSFQPEWFHDGRIGGECNHSSRSHIREDLQRYFFASCFAKVYNRSPKIGDFPKELRPKHENIQKAVEENLFSDRFRVQIKDKPSTTITSHISKDGHYYIHPDPTQCRSLTVREAARLQTFPDNYYFEGPRTMQYHQVGNAVPPLLAQSIAQIVYEVIETKVINYVRLNTLNHMDMKHDYPENTLKTLIVEQEQRIVASFPSDKRLALLELTRAIDIYFRHLLALQEPETKDDRHYLREFGWHKALSLFIGEHCHQSGAPLLPSNKDLQQWADSVLMHCGRLGICEWMLGLSRYGLGRIWMPSNREFRFELKGRHVGLESIESEEFDFLSRLTDEMDKQARSQLLAFRSKMISRMSKLVKPWRRHYIQYETAPDIDAYYQRLGLFWARTNYLGADAFTDDTVFGGQHFGLYKAMVVNLAGFALKHIDFCEALWAKHPKLEFRNILTIYKHFDELCGYVATALDITVQESTQALSTVTLTPENRSVHLLSPKNYLPPLIQVSSESVIESISGTLSPSPFYFMLTELRRQYPQDWDRALVFRERTFREELYALFPQQDVAKLHGPLKLRSGGKIVTDIDACLFDTKNGVLGLFQLKWQEPFGSSMQKREAKKLNFLNDSNAWIDKVTAWFENKTPKTIMKDCGLSQHTAKEISRILLFVLGRNFSHFSGDTEPDGRAAWGMWPQVLRITKEAVDFQNYNASDPLGWFDTTLRKESPIRKPRPNLEGWECNIGDYHIVLEPLH